MEPSTISSRMSETFTIFSRSFVQYGIPYYIVVFCIEILLFMGISSLGGFTLISLVDHPSSQIVLILIIFLTFYFLISLIVKLIWMKWIMTNFFHNDTHTSLSESVGYIIENGKNLFYMYWRIFRRLFYVFLVSLILALVGGIILSLTIAILISDPSQSKKTLLLFVIFIGTTVIPQIPILIRQIRLLFVSTSCLWHNTFSKEKIQNSEKATYGIVWSILGNFIILLVIPYINMYLSNTIMQGSLWRVMIWELCVISTGYFFIIYRNVYYRDVILPREKSAEST